MEAPEDEMILAELIAVASYHGLRSCRGSLFRGVDGIATLSNNYAYDKIDRPPRSAVKCCVLGAQMLLSNPRRITSCAGNDAGQFHPAPSCPEALRDWNIGAAFEIAMRGSDE